MAVLGEVEKHDVHHKWRGLSKKRLRKREEEEEEQQQQPHLLDSRVG